MRNGNSCVVYKFRTVNPGFPPSSLQNFWLPAIRRHIGAALYFCSVNCADVALSVFYSAVSTKPVGGI